MDEANHVASFDAGAVSRFSELEILDAVQQLSPSYRAVFNLYVIEGYSHKEISQLLDVNESTSRSNLVKARLKLQNILLKQR
jgi:RNA polymerase sigma-70 factor (ECF subfamily)